MMVVGVIIVDIIAVLPQKLDDDVNGSGPSITDLLILGRFVD